MATSTIPLDGKLYRVSYSLNLTTPSWKLIGYQQSNNVNHSTETREIIGGTQCGNRERRATLNDWTISGTSGFYHGTSGASNLKELWDAKEDGLVVLIKVEPYDCSEAAVPVGELYWKGQTICTQLDVALGSNQTATCNYTFVANGALTIDLTV
jgi:hypothetical protein